MSVRTRIAPSPTGDPHVGTLYIALFNWAFAQNQGGQFILRIEDTDCKRSRPQYEQNIYDALTWAGISWIEGPDKGGPYGPYRQSDRLDIYRKYALQLVEEGKAYKCFATPQELAEMREIALKSGLKAGYDRRFRNLSPQEVKEREEAKQPYVIRLKVPLQGTCVFEDQIKGRISYPWSEIDDQVLMKSDGFPTYHLAAVVDDHLMQISHVIRGDEWLSSTPKHILLYEAFGWTPPIFMHMPLLLGKDGRKLSKRRNPTSIFYYRDSGFLPDALLNFLSLMGYSMVDEKEVYSLGEFVSSFDPKRIGISGAFFDIKKLEWLNQKYLIQNLTEEDLLQKLKEWSFNDEFFRRLMPLVHTRIKTFGEFMELCSFFFINHIPYTEALLCPKASTPTLSAMLLQAIIWSLDEQEDWGEVGIEKASHEVAEKFDLSHKKILMPLLFGTIMGKECGPPLYASVDILGKERTRARFLHAIEFLGGISNKKMDQLKDCWAKSDCRSLGSL